MDIKYPETTSDDWKVGELYKLTFPENNNFEDFYRYFSQDVGSQTEESDVLTILELSEALSKLTKDNANLQRDLNLIRSTLQSEFHRRLTNASNQLYTRMNQRLDDVERSQRDRIEIVRRAFRTQLSDALNHMASIYNEKMRNALMNTRSFMESEESIKFNKKITDLTSKLKKSDAKVKELTKQITEYQENLIQSKAAETESEGSEHVELYMNSDDELVEDDGNKIKDNLIKDLNKRIEDLETENNSNLNLIGNLQSKVQAKNDELFSINEILDKRKTENKLMETGMKQLEEKCNKLQLEVKSLNDTKPALIPKQENIVRKPLSLEFNVQKNFKENLVLNDELIKLRQELQSLQSKESERILEFNKLKTATLSEKDKYLEEIKILRSINCKLKEEMFNRSEIHSNFSALHTASVAYAKNNQPMGILPKNIEESKSKTQTLDVFSTANSKSGIYEKDEKILSNFTELTMSH